MAVEAIPDLLVEGTADDAEPVALVPAVEPAEPVVGDPEPEVTDDDAEVTEEPAASAEKPSGKGKSSYQKRVDELTWKTREAERQRQERDDRIIALERELAAARQPAKPEPVAAKPEGRPKLTDFTDYEDYVEAVADWKSKETLKTERANWEQQSQANSLQQGLEDLKQRGSQKYPDFMENQIRLMKQAPQPSHVIGMFLSPSGPDVAYALGNDLELAARIAQMPPLGAALELGRLSARLEAATSGPAKPPVSTAKPPIKPVAGSPAAPVEADESEEDTDVFLSRHLKPRRRA